MVKHILTCVSKEASSSFLRDMSFLYNQICVSRGSLGLYVDELGHSVVSYALYSTLTNKALTSANAFCLPGEKWQK